MKLVESWEERNLLKVGQDDYLNQKDFKIS